ncbi:acyl-CoA dehydrogenase family protein [Bordetella hinzii]|uniref:acyl-CoA dehydrogenase family protein n=1 Tax=Bordetella hinzii TaxID=103855 RepID=UPI00045A1C55|nr:acyl-CoA dehydrogenase family protein [Bordetella hinzii]KCB44659.1 hypothetical protein L538_1676 [Bordetella hinzii 4161]KXA73436.1 acyl-CoA dehydrogenase [Bordetella hinzii LMG 13501]QDJ39335.1 acyl-CoA dehydrogenase [Bordetella hinzii]VEH23507.1 Uncharacterised protein [Bordetella hinzii]
MTSTSAHVSPALAGWLHDHAEALDSGTIDSLQVLPRLAADGVFARGTAAGQGSGDIGHAIETIAQLATHSLTAAFVGWGQSVVIETLLRGANPRLAEACLPELLAGRLAGASGLSNAIKSLGGFDRLRIQAAERPGGWALTGRVDWITNLRPAGFLATAATATPQGGIAIVALRDHVQGLTRHPDLPLMGLRASSTAALDLVDLPLAPADVIHPDARQFLPGLRPVLVGLQCGFAIGLARAGLHASAGRADVLAPAHEALAARLATLTAELLQGVRQERFVTQPARLFALRIALAETAQQAVELELQATGGTAYLQGEGGFARRWREAAFLPIVTPSLVQLKTELSRLQAPGSR